MKNRIRHLFVFVLLITICVEAFAAEKLSGIPIGVNMSSVARAFDNNDATNYEGNKSSFDWVGLDLGEEHVISRLGWMAPGNNTGAVILGVFQGATLPDFSDAIPIWIVTEAPKAYTMVYADIDCSRGFRYVRYVGPSGSYSRVAELEFYGTPGKGNDNHLWQITNLPTVSINTVDGVIPYDKEHEISSTVIIISDNGTKVLEKSETGIRERGNGSRTFPKKPWRIKFSKKQNVLDATAKAKKWTLINNYGDKTLMRNMLAFDIARKMGMAWVPYCTPVDVVLNGEYKGCYQLCDQVEVNEGRLEIDEMTPDDISGESITGGYFVEVDAYAPEEISWFTSSYYRIPVTIKSPDDDEITPEQRKYIVDYFNQVEAKTKDPSPETGYRTIFDNESFIQHMLVNELAGNTDAYFSTFMYKKRNDERIYTGPVWDFDLGFENDQRTYPLVQNSGNGYLWNTSFASSANGMRSFAQNVLIKDDATADEILEVWKKARKAGLTIDWLYEKIDEYAKLLDESQKLNFMRWPIMNTRVHQNPRIYGSYEGECDAVKNYIAEQIPHLDMVIGFDPENDMDGDDGDEDGDDGDEDGDDGDEDGDDGDEDGDDGDEDGDDGDEDGDDGDEDGDDGNEDGDDGDDDGDDGDEDGDDGDEDGISDIENDVKYNIEYFTPSGVKVSNPSAPGVYIEWRGIEVRKVIVR